MGTALLDLAYRRQRNTAKARGIAWHFDFDGWLRVWVDSGHLDKRGRGRGCYVMARRGDVGPYEASNVEIILYEQNARDSRSNHPESPQTLSRRAIGRGVGWTFVRGAYQVSCARKYIGRYPTQVDAERAYAHAVAERTARLGITGSGRESQGTSGKAR